jgi:hypothetical protein
VLFEPGLPLLSGEEAVPVEESAEARLFEARPQRLRRSRIRPRIAEKNVVSLAAKEYLVTPAALGCVVWLPSLITLE